MENGSGGIPKSDDYISVRILTEKGFVSDLTFSGEKVGFVAGKLPITC